MLSQDDIKDIANHFALASGKQKAEGCCESSRGFSLHESNNFLFCLTHVRTDLQYIQIIQSLCRMKFGAASKSQGRPEAEGRVHFPGLHCMQGTGLHIDAYTLTQFGRIFGHLPSTQWGYYVD